MSGLGDSDGHWEDDGEKYAWVEQMQSFASGLSKLNKCKTTGLANVTLNRDEATGILYALDVLRGSSNSQRTYTAKHDQQQGQDPAQGQHEDVQ